MSVWNEENRKNFEEKNNSLRKKVNEYGGQLNINVSNYKNENNLNSCVNRIIQALLEFEISDRQFLIEICSFFDSENKIDDSIYASYL